MLIHSRNTCIELKFTDTWIGCKALEWKIMNNRRGENNKLSKKKIESVENTKKFRCYSCIC